MPSTNELIDVASALNEDFGDDGPTVDATFAGHSSAVVLREVALWNDQDSDTDAIERDGFEAHVRGKLADVVLALAKANGMRLVRLERGDPRTREMDLTDKLLVFAELAWRALEGFSVERLTDIGTKRAEEDRKLALEFFERYEFGREVLENPERAILTNREMSGRVARPASPHTAPVVLSAVKSEVSVQGDAAKVVRVSGEPQADGSSTATYERLVSPVKIVKRKCKCDDVRDRRWNPNTGKCETCGAAYYHPLVDEAKKALGSSPTEESVLRHAREKGSLVDGFIAATEEASLAERVAVLEAEERDAKNHARKFTPEEVADAKGKTLDGFFADIAREARRLDDTVPNDDVVEDMQGNTERVRFPVGHDGIVEACARAAAAFMRLKQPNGEHHDPVQVAQHIRTLKRSPAKLPHNMAAHRAAELLREEASRVRGGGAGGDEDAIADALEAQAAAIMRGARS